jgi:hypothetical protein
VVYKTCNIIANRSDLSNDIIARHQDGLAALGKDEVFETVLNDLKNPDEQLREQAGKTLVCFGVTIAGRLSEFIRDAQEPEVRPLGASVIKNIGPGAVAKFMDIFKATTDPEMRQHLITVLDIIEPAESETIFTELISDPDRHIRQAALDTIKRTDKSIILKTLMPVVQNNDRNMIYLVLDILGELAYAEAAPAIVELLKRTGDKKLQMACCEVLGKIGDEAAIPALVEIVNNKKFLGILGGYADEVRGQATRALGHFKSALAQEALQKALNDSSPLVRSAARLGLKL